MNLKVCLAIDIISYEWFQTDSLFLEYRFNVEQLSNSKLMVTYEKQNYSVEIRSSNDDLVLLIDGHQFRCRMHIDGDNCTLYSNISRSPFEFKLQTPPFLAKLAASGMGGVLGASATTGDPVAPMPGIIDKILVQEGTAVSQGQPLLVMTAMKMEHVIKASRNGTIAKVNATVGKVVNKGEVLLSFIVEEAAKKKSQ